MRHRRIQLMLLVALALGLGCKKKSAISSDPDVLLSGEVALGEGVTLPSEGVIFIAVRGGDAVTGMPILVEKLEGPLPASFTLRKENLMIEGSDVPESLSVEARFDQDSDAISRLPGDLRGTLTSIKRGSVNLTLALTEVEGGFKPGRSVQ